MRVQHILLLVRRRKITTYTVQLTAANAEMRRVREAPRKVAINVKGEKPYRNGMNPRIAREPRR